MTDYSLKNILLNLVCLTQTSLKPTPPRNLQLCRGFDPSGDTMRRAVNVGTDSVNYAATASGFVVRSVQALIKGAQTCRTWLGSLLVRWSLLRHRSDSKAAGADWLGKKHWMAPCLLSIKDLPRQQAPKRHAESRSQPLPENCASLIDGKLPATSWMEGRSDFERRLSL